jgi:hypothetical protein
MCERRIWMIQLAQTCENSNFEVHTLQKKKPILWLFPTLAFRNGIMA